MSDTGPPPTSPREPGEDELERQLDGARMSEGAAAGLGPAQVTVTAQPPAVPASLPVYRYFAAHAADRDAVAAGVGARAASGSAVYEGAGFRLTFDEKPRNGREPTFQLAAPGGAPAGSPPAAADARRAADEFLDSHRLLPSWPAEVTVEAQPSSALVRYQRQFDVPGVGRVPQVDGTGSPAGLEVVVAPDRSVTLVTGPVPLAVESRPYRTRPPAQAARDAAGQPSAAAPTVALDRVRLVYVAVADGDQGYFVPGYLFSGGGTPGQPPERRVLVPALDASALR